MFYTNENKLRATGEYYHYDLDTGLVPPEDDDLFEGLFEETYEKQPFYYKGQPKDIQTLLDAKSPTLWDLDNWRVENVTGPSIFQDAYIKRKYASVTYRHWWCLSQQSAPKMLANGIVEYEREKPGCEYVATVRIAEVPPIQTVITNKSIEKTTVKKPSLNDERIQIDSGQLAPKKNIDAEPKYEYFFSTVESTSLEIYEGEAEDPVIADGRTIRVRYVDRPKGKKVLASPELTRLLYDIEAEKAREYLTNSGVKGIGPSDWLYTLGMYLRHKEDYRRVMRLIGKTKGQIISYGDRAGALEPIVQSILYYDQSPSRFSLRQVLQSDTSKLRVLSQSKNNIIVLLYTYTLLTSEEKSILDRAQATVIVWGEARVSSFPYGTRGVYSNRPVAIFTPTETQWKSTLPFSESYAMLLDRVFLDEGIALDALIKMRVLKTVPIHKYSFPQVTQLGGLPIERRKPHPGGVYVVHEYDKWYKHRASNPYYVPLGRTADRVLKVSSHMTIYRVRTLYAFSIHGDFATEYDSISFVKVHSASDTVVGFFSTPVVSAGLTVVETTTSPGNIWIRLEGQYYVIETLRETHYVSRIRGYQDTELMSFILSQSEKNGLKEALIGSSFKELRDWLEKVENG